MVCECGARDDDGERMLLCVKCNEQKHARCCGIKDADTVSVFTCSACLDSLVQQRADYEP